MIAMPLLIQVMLTIDLKLKRGPQISNFSTKDMFTLTTGHETDIATHLNSR